VASAERAVFDRAAAFEQVPPKTNYFEATARVTVWTVVAILALATGRALFESLRWRLTGDASLNYYIAVQLLHGAVPYRDILDPNMPGTYWVHEFIVANFGIGDVPWRVFDLICLAGICAAAGAIMRRAGAAACALGVLLLAGYHLSAGPTIAGERDYIAVLPLMVAALATIRFIENEQRRELAISGAAIGLSVLFKPTFVLAPAFLMLVLVIHKWRGFRSMIVDGLWLGGPMLMVLCAAAATLAAQGALIPLIDTYRDYVLPIYSKLYTENAWNYFSLVGIHLLPCIAMILAACLLTFSSRLYVRHTAAAFALFGLVSFYLQGKGFFYYLCPWAMFTIVWAAIALGDMLKQKDNLKAQCAVIMLVPLMTFAVYHGRLVGTVSFLKPMEDPITRDLARVVQPGDKVQVLDNSMGAVQALLRLGVSEPTRFFYEFPFFQDKDISFRRKVREEFIEALDAHPPKAIVITNSEYTTLHFGYERINSWPSFAELLRKRYALRFTYTDPLGGQGYRIYVRKDNTFGPASHDAAARGR